MVTMTKKPEKLCFVISPIGAEGTAERNAADWFLEIVRAALGADYLIERADDHKKSGLITTQIIALIERADLIVADLTTIQTFTMSWASHTRAKSRSYR